MQRYCYRVTCKTTNAANDTIRLSGNKYTAAEAGVVYVVAKSIIDVAVDLDGAEILHVERIGFGYQHEPLKPLTPN